MKKKPDIPAVEPISRAKAQSPTASKTSTARKSAIPDADVLRQAQVRWKNRGTTILTCMNSCWSGMY